MRKDGESIAGKKKETRCRRNAGNRTLLVVFGLVEEEIGGELFILVTGEIGLNGLVPWES
jgi:hypothetical protein